MELNESLKTEKNNLKNNFMETNQLKNVSGVASSEDVSELLNAIGLSGADDELNASGKRKAKKAAKQEKKAGRQEKRASKHERKAEKHHAKAGTPADQSASQVAPSGGGGGGSSEVSDSQDQSQYEDQSQSQDQGQDYGDQSQDQSVADQASDMQEEINEESDGADGVWAADGEEKETFVEDKKETKAAADSVWSNATGEEKTPIYKNPYVIGGGVIAAIGAGILIYRAVKK